MSRKKELIIKFSVGLALAIIFQLYLMSKGSNFWMWFN
jgi:hypothetical protein